VTDTFAELSSRCYEAVANKYDQGQQCEAMPLLAQELQLMHERGWQSHFVEADGFTSELRREGMVCRLVGSGCSSIVTFLLGMSDVDPLRYNLPFERFYPVGRRNAPQFLLSLGVSSVQELGHIKSPQCITLRHMTGLEKAAWFCPVNHDIPHSANDSYELLWSDDSQDIYGLNWPPVGRLANRLRPRCIQGIATVEAFAEIGITHPAVVQKFISTHFSGSAVHTDPGRFCESGSIIYQEQVMAYLEKWAGIRRSATYDLVKLGSRDGWNDRQIAGAIQDGLITNCASEEEAEKRFKFLAAATKYAVCKAHYISDAITTHRAVFLKSKYPQEYQSAVDRFFEADDGAL
jgi:DNA polymerase III alpha subunit